MKKTHDDLPAAVRVSRRRFLRTTAATPLALAGPALLAACGGGDGDATAATGPAGADGTGAGAAAGSPTGAPNAGPGLRALPEATFSTERSLLSEPMLQNPGPDSVRVVWYSENEGGRHSVRVGEGLDREFVATTTRMSHMLEDSGSQVFQRITGTWTVPRERRVFRHEALITGLAAGQRVPYVAVSEVDDRAWRSGRYTLQPLPRAGQPLKILLTSDHQNNPMASANMQKMFETVGVVDAVLFPGDFVSQPNRASEWFDRVGGGGNANFPGNPAFFQSLQGTTRRWNPGAPYEGAPVLQHAPLYGCLGNHEYPGRWRMDPRTDNPGNPLPVTINNMDNDPQPRWYAQARYEARKAQVNPADDPALRDKWIEDNSFEWTTYREMWSLPEGPEGKAYYGARFGDVFVLALDANRVWRGWGATERGKFTERFVNADGRVTQNADEWGFGDVNFRPFGRGSTQHQWLEQVLQSEACRTARWRIAISHQTMAGLGDNAVPVQAEIRTTVELADGTLIGPFQAGDWPAQWPTVREALARNTVRFVRHEYPRDRDQWLTDIEPLLLQHGVHLVHTGHSHLWNRTTAQGRLHYLEASNFGNSFGAMFFEAPQQGVSASQGPRNGGNVPGGTNWVSQTTAPVAANAGGRPRTTLTWNAADYPIAGEAHGRPMALPTLANPMRSVDRRAAAWPAEQDLPFVASNNICTFSVLDTATGVVSSWCFDTRDAAAAPVKFDEFRIG